MNDNKNPNAKPKKGMPGGFFLFVLAMILIILTIQTLTTDKKGKVAFSHQIEHLVNLDLVHPEESRKIAQNDNLVTFSGAFREKETQEGSERFRYLEQLNENHELQNNKENLAKSLDLSQKNVTDAAQWFLLITGMDVSKNGYAVVGSVYDTPQRVNSIIIKNVPDSDIVSLATLSGKIKSLDSSPSQSQIDQIGNDLKVLVQYFRSPKLGIGSESIKQQLKDMATRIESKDANLTANEQLAAYTSSFNELEQMSSRLNEESNNVRLLGLRSVRNYMENLDQYIVIAQKLEKNNSLLDKSRKTVANVVWFFNNKEVSTRALEQEDPEVFSNWFAQSKQEWANFDSNKSLAFRAPDQPRNAVLEKTFKSQEPPPNYSYYFFTFLPFILIGLVVWYLLSRQAKGVGSSAMNFGKSPAKLLTKETNKVTFKDVAGVEEAKEELSEIVDFLKDPQKFTALGARIPKGVLLVGPPGTGKTLVAKAVAGEADRPFFSISGSDFVEMFVGVGASRIRDLFGQAKKSSPCIIFVDEIDAVGRHRGAGIGGGHDEREQTLNQLLVEMDGFDTKEGVILMAATNRPDILDKALLRPGRFDRRVVLDLPDVKGRNEILKVHARKIKIDPSVNLMEIAKNTPGASGADLENILNEAALMAARRGRSAVTSAEAKEACDKVRYGKERKSLEMDMDEKKTTAFHESGHAIVGLTVKNADPVDKVTIIPRGFSLGATHFMPKKNRLSYWKKEVLDHLAIALGGRAAEEVFVHDLSSGAQQDISQATKLARAMVCEWGMTDELGTVSYDENSGGEQYLGVYGSHDRKYSEETARRIDSEVKKLIDEAHKRALDIVKENEDKVKLMTDMLIEFETLDVVDIKEIMDGSWSAENKKKRLQEAEDLQRKSPPPPPKKEKQENLKINPNNPPRPQQT